jgi:hypothetical protein
MKSQRQKDQGLTAQIVENERLKAQLKAIANELAVKQDVDKSLADTKAQLIESERDRKQLQDKITKLTEEFER